LGTEEISFFGFSVSSHMVALSCRFQLGINPNSKLFGVWIDAFGNGEQGDIGGFSGRSFAHPHPD
jgi:hypothetical protein